MTVADIFTPRLRLVTMTAEMLRADAMGREELARVVGVMVPRLWPPEHWESHVFGFLEEQHTTAPYSIPWNRYLVLRADEPTLIGTMNGFPKSRDVAEVGYSILSPWQRLGLATEAMAAFVHGLFLDGNLNTITAQTFPHLVASKRVLEKCGFLPDGMGDEEGSIRFSLHRSELWQRGQDAGS